MQKSDASGPSRQRKPKRKRQVMQKKDRKNKSKMRKVRKEIRKEYMNLYGLEAPLHFAVAMNDINKLKQLLRTMCPNTYHPPTGETPLHLAVRLGKLDLVKKLRRHPKIRGDLLTLSGPKSVVPVGSTATDIAHKYNKPDIVRFLNKLERDKKDDELFTSPLADNLRVLSELVQKVSLERQSLATVVGQRDSALRAELKSIELRILSIDQDCNDLKVKFKKEKDDCFGVKLLKQRQADEVKLDAALTKGKDIERDLAACQQRVPLPKEELELEFDWVFR